MKKMKTLFKREFEGNNIVKTLNEVEETCKWVLKENCIATEKIDGTCCLINNGILYKRYDFKVFHSVFLIWVFPESCGAYVGK